MKKVTLVFALVFVCGTLISGQARVQVHPKFASAIAALNYIGSQPVSIGELDDGRQQGQYNSYVANQSNIFFGGLGSYNSVGVFDVFGSEYSSEAYGALLASTNQFLTQRVWASAKNVIAANHPNAASAKFSVNAFLAIARENVSGGGFNGPGVAQATSSVIYAVPGLIPNGVRQGVYVGSQVLDHVQIQSQKRKVQAGLFLSITDAQTGQILWMSNGSGVGEINDKELSYVGVAGFEKTQINYPNSYGLARATVDAAWR